MSIQLWERYALVAKKNWSAVNNLQAAYNEAVGAQDLPSLDEHVELSGASTAMRDSAGLAASRMTLNYHKKRWQAEHGRQWLRFASARGQRPQERDG